MRGPSLKLACVAAVVVLSANPLRAAEAIEKGDAIVVTARESQVKEEDNVVAVVAKGDRFKVVAVQGDWVGVEVGNKSGWLPRGDVARAAAGKGIGRAPKAPEKEKPAYKKWAILIGCDGYLNVGKLHCCGDDVRDLAAQLVASGFPRDQVFVLCDKTENPIKYLPNKVNIERELKQLLALPEKGDLVVVAFSGHGVKVEDKDRWCPLDASVDDLKGTTIAVDDVYDWLKQSKAAMKLMVVDACRNDFVPRGIKGLAAGKGLGDYGAGEPPPNGIALLRSCGEGQRSAEDRDKLKHGVFMYFVLEGLRGKARNDEGAVSLLRLAAYASEKTKKYVHEEFNDFQTPALVSDLDDGAFELCPAGGGKELLNSLGMKLVLIPAGEFRMGGEESAADMVAFFKDKYGWDASADTFKDEHPAHRVRITKPFYLAATPVTRGQFRAFVSDSGYQTEAEKDGKGGYGTDDKGSWSQKPEYNWRNPGFAQTDEHPVVNVSWNDATAFCRWLGRKEDKEYRLPTEAQWEYACRAGTTTRYWCGDDPEELAKVANVADAAAKERFPDWKYTIRANDGYVFTSPVGSFRANPFGLYDMHGNVWQWCADWYGKDYYAASPTDDPEGPDTGSDRVYRGGGWLGIARDCRSAYRGGYDPSDRFCYLGFRLALVPSSN